jgi:hypothetical protein
MTSINSSMSISYDNIFGQKLTHFGPITAHKSVQIHIGTLSIVYYMF